MTHANTTDSAAEDLAQRLRHDLVSSLQAEGWIHDPRVAEALAAVPRHRFVPDAAPEAAYARGTVSIKDDATGASLSCASTPAIVAMMLHQADLAPGQRILELGAGSGYNAALLSHLTTPSGQVTTIDVDSDLAEHARTHLADAGYAHVRVLCGDGAAGHPDGGPFDRIVATVGTFDIPPAWLDQLTPSGRLVVPVRLAGDASRSIALTPADGYWRGADVQMCTFMPLRHSPAADPRRVLDLTGDEAVTLWTNQDQDIHPESVRNIFTEERTTTWTGVVFGNNESFGDLWLWLALTLDNSLSRMPATTNTTKTGVVEPMLRWGSMATAAQPGERGLAYMTLRATGEGHELGVIGHGTQGIALAEHMTHEITHWNAHYRTHEPTVDLHPHPTLPPEPEPGRFVLARPNAHLVVTWQEEPLL